MWHEARKQEKKIRGMMVDFKRRAERRRDYYERIKQDPAQFLQVHGRPAKIHLDPAIALAADSPATMMSWQGNANNLIDRFDVRAHLDIIPEYVPTIDVPKLSSDELIDDRKACYERYRTLVHNDFLGLNEDKFLHQIYLEERFGPVLKPTAEEEKKKLLVDKKAAIGYVYEDSTNFDTPPILAQSVKVSDELEDDDDKDDLSDIDLDISVNVNELTEPQRIEMNDHSHKYGMTGNDFISFLMEDKDEADQLRLAKEIEEEKAMFSGRNSRRERRALREKKLAGRRFTSPPSYAARDSPTYTPMRHSTSKSRSRSRSPPNAGKIMFITSFGDDASDGEAGATGKSENKKNSKGNNIKKHESRNTSDHKSKVVIGPLLPEEIDTKRKSETESSRRYKDKRSVSSSHSSSHSRRRDDSRSNSRFHSSSRSRRHRRSSSSSSGSSYNRRKQIRRRYSRSRSPVRRRSRTPTSRSRSRSRSRKTLRDKRLSKSRSKSRSRSVKKSASPQLPPPPVKSYYRHSLSRSSSDLSDDSDSQDKKEDSNSCKSLNIMNKSSQLINKAGPSSSITPQAKLTPQERLKRRMQLALNRQYKADKRAQIEKTEKQLQEKIDREEELREMAIKMRQRERERRHKLRGYGYDSDSDASCTKWERDDSERRYSDSRDYPRPRHYSSSDDERPPKDIDRKYRDTSPHSAENIRELLRMPSPSRNIDVVISDRKKYSRRSRDRSLEKSPRRSRGDTRERHRSYDSRRSKSNSPRRYSYESSHRRDRRSRSRSSSRSRSRTHSNRNTRSLVDY